LKKIVFIGPILGTRPENLPDKVKLREKLGLETDLPIIFATISGPIKEKTYLINMLKNQLKKLASSDEYQIVMSLGNPSTTGEPLLEDKIVIYDWVPNRLEFMKASDLVIARAGLGTITDSICFGKPQILIPTPSHTEQFFNAKRAEKLGVAKTLEQENLNYHTLSSTIQKMLEKQFLSRTREIQKEVSKYNALDTAIRIMTNLEK
jgi:UDP:flavonoid glycosyltransferase YjiC (YdhE family)